LLLFEFEICNDRTETYILYRLEIGFWLQYFHNIALFNNNKTRSIIGNNQVCDLLMLYDCYVIIYIYIFSVLVLAEMIYIVNFDKAIKTGTLPIRDVIL
jgi:hypothetical protein